MEKEITNNELMEFLVENMATKGDLAQMRSEMATKDDIVGVSSRIDSLELRVDAGFRMVSEEIKETNERIDRLDRRTSEDVGAVIKDLFKVKQQLNLNA